MALVVEDDEPSSPNADMRRSVGAALAAARLEAGLTIEDVSGRLNLRSSFIVALEEGRGHEHMDWVYERNHIRAMAAVVALDLPDDLQELPR